MIEGHQDDGENQYEPRRLAMTSSWSKATKAIST